MHDKYPYPESEHYEFPATPLEVNDELSSRYDGARLREELLLNHAYYKETELYDALKSYSQLTRYTPSDGTEHTHPDSNYSTTFFAGSIAALHAQVHTAPHDRKEWILERNPLAFMESDELTDQRKALTLQRIANHLSVWRSSHSAYMLESQDEAFCVSLTKLARATFIDTPGKGYEHMFIDGYLYSANLLWQYEEHYFSLYKI